MSNVLQIDKLRVTFATDAGDMVAVRDVSLAVAPGEVVAIVGESLNDLADPRLRTKRRADGGPVLTAETSAVPGGSLADVPNIEGLEGRA